MINAVIDFSKKLREWDGFGFNYVQTSMTRDFKEFPQDYGGFSILSQQKRDEILDLVFGPEGLKPGLTKMFLDPLHQPEQDGDFDHETTTEWMLYFNKEGIKRTRQRGGSLRILSTLYGPPAWATKQKQLRGRDIDPDCYKDLACYIIDWLKFLKKEGLPADYFSLHNQGDKPYQYPADGSGMIGNRIDYNGYWSPQQVADFLVLLKPMLL